MNNDRIKDVFPNLQSYRDRQGLWVKVDSIAAGNSWDSFDSGLGDDRRAVQPGDDSKESDGGQSTDSISNPFPGEHWKDQYPDKKDPRGEPAFIELKWNKEARKMEDCDALHMLYLLQHACEQHRRRVIERNKYFTSISRADRYIAHVDTPQIITNFVKWHNEDRDSNVFTGKLLKEGKASFVVNELIGKIGDIPKGAAIRIFNKLRKEVMIEYDEWTWRNTKLKLYTWGFTKFYLNEKVLEECSVEDIVTLFTFVNEDDQKQDDERLPDEETVNGVFAYFEGLDTKSGRNLMSIDGWKDRIVEWIYEQNIDGRKLKEKNNKEINRTMRAKLEPDEKRAKRLNGPCGKMLNFCKKMPVHRVLMAAKAQKEGYHGPHSLAECSVDSIVTLLSFVGDVDDLDDSDGVFELIEIEGGNALRVKWVRSEQIDGKYLAEIPSSSFIPKIRSVLIPEAVLNPKGALSANEVDRACQRIWEHIQSVPVGTVLAAAKRRGQ